MSGISEKVLLVTPLVHLSNFASLNLSKPMARKLALAVGGFVERRNPSEATVEDLLSYLPMRYEDRSNLIQIDQLYDGLEASVDLHTKVAGGFQVGKKRPHGAPPLFIFEITACDAERKRKPVVVWWFISGKQARRIIGYYTEMFQRGTRFVAYGKWEWDARRNTFSLKLAKPDELEIISRVSKTELGLPKEAAEIGDENPSTIQTQQESDAGEITFEETDPRLAMIHVGRRVPVYRKLGNFQTKRLREIVYSIANALDEKSAPEDLPRDIVARNKLVSHLQALREIHFPPEKVSLVDYARGRSDAHSRLIFEEFFWLSLALQLKRGERIREPKGATIKLEEKMRQRMKGVLPFKLTGAQSRVVKTIFGDMQSDAPMNRLIQGDVGSGKTIVALLAMLLSMENGYQTALMAPTEILADQHARNFKKLLAKTPFRVELLLGSTKAAEKRKLQEAIKIGEVDCVIGTHAIIQEAVAFKKLGLVVVDEQHRFGVAQRAELRARGFNPDVLVMTATPIPRSLAMTVYGDLDVSIIDELPPGRTPVKTVVVGEDKRAGVYKGIEREIVSGRQVYVVYPLVEESEKIDLKAATKMFEELRDKIFPKRKVALLHGRMKPAEKEEAMKKFASGETNILVATTVVEVGVDVPNASLMIIEHAERFGLSQLHQLRGRVGRGAEQSFCVLLTGDKKTATAKERLGIMEETNDGFRIAEKDLEIRGEGEIFGTRQAGLRAFRVANLVRDFELLQTARKEAETIYAKSTGDPEAREALRRVSKDRRFQFAGIG